MYRHPALVPLGEKPKSWKDNLSEGNWQISHLASVYVVPKLYILYITLGCNNKAGPTV